MKFGLVIVYFCSFMRISRSDYNAGVTITINSIFTNFTSLSLICNSWSYNLQTLIITPSELYKIEVIVFANTTKRQTFQTQQIENTVSRNVCRTTYECAISRICIQDFVSIFFYPQINCTQKGGTFLVLPPSVYCDEYSVEQSFPLDLHNTANEEIVSLCNDTRIDFSYTYECLSDNYYPPSCTYYCQNTNTPDTCYTCNTTGSGLKICCPGYYGDDCSQQVTTSIPQVTTSQLPVTTCLEIAQTTCVCQNFDSFDETKENNYFIAMIVMSCVSFILLVILVILLVWICCANFRSKNKKEASQVADYRTTSRVIEQPRAKVVNVTEKRVAMIPERRLPAFDARNDIRQPRANVAPSIHSDSSEELAYFDKPWQNFGDDQEIKEITAQYSEPRKRRNPPIQIQPVSQRISDQSQRNRYQDPNTIVVLDGDDDEGPAYYNRAADRNGTYI